MTDLELLQQALDALEIAEVDGNCYYEATELLRKRLAQCDRCGKNLGGEGDIHACVPDPIGDAQDRLIAELAAQPEQEPVAWWNNTCTHIDLNVSGRGTPLYTHPPAAQRKPLTDEQLNEIADRNYSHWVEFARAIEAAHGIKENT